VPPWNVFTLDVACASWLFIGVVLPSTCSAGLIPRCAASDPIAYWPEGVCIFDCDHWWYPWVKRAAGLRKELEGSNGGDQKLLATLQLLDTGGELHTVTRDVDPRFELGAVMTCAKMIKPHSSPAWPHAMRFLQAMS